MTAHSAWKARDFQAPQTSSWTIKISRDVLPFRDIHLQLPRLAERILIIWESRDGRDPE